MALKPLVIITGASSGIGQAAAKRFAKEGHAVLALARRLDKMEADFGGMAGVMCRAVDVTKLESFTTAVKEAEAKFGPAQCVVNNAGIMLLSAFVEQDPKEWDTMIAVNITGVLNGIKAVLAGFVERKDGHVINISSIAGLKFFGNHSVYCACKAAICMLTEGLREEHAANGIRFTCVNPGAVETELLDHITSPAIVAGYQEWKKSMTQGVLTSDDVSNAIWYAFSQPKHCCIREITMACVEQGP